MELVHLMHMTLVLGSGAVGALICEAHTARGRERWRAWATVWGASAALVLYFASTVVARFDFGATVQIDGYTILLGAGVLVGYGIFVTWNAGHARAYGQLRDFVQEGAARVEARTLLVASDPRRARGVLDRAFYCSSAANRLRVLMQGDSSDHEQAIRLLDEVIDRQPLAHAYYLRAVLKARVGFTVQETQRDLDEAVAIAPLYAELASEDPDLKRDFQR